MRNLSLSSTLGWLRLPPSLAHCAASSDTIFRFGCGSEAGRKGVATTVGVVLGLMPMAFLVAGLVWVATFYLSRYVSLASLLAAAVLPVSVWWLTRWASPVKSGISPMFWFLRRGGGARLPAAPHQHLPAAQRHRIPLCAQAENRRTAQLMPTPPFAKIAVLGAGSWGTALAVWLAERGHAVTLWGHDAAHVEQLRATRRNEKYLPGIELPGNRGFHFQPRRNGRV